MGEKVLKKAVMALLVLTGVGSVNASAWWQPAPGTSWEIQLQGTLDTTYAVGMYDIDLVDTPQAVIDDLHSRNIKVVCYFSAGSYEKWRTDASSFPADVLGKSLAGWPGERWLDIRRIDLLAPIMEARMDLAQQKHCDAVDPDNVDGFANTTGFPLVSNDQLLYNQWLANAAHARGMAAGLKNDLAQIQDLVASFDFSVNEQCFWYKECDLLTPFITANKPVFAIEYRGKLSKICADANARNFDTLKKHRNLKIWRRSCR